MGVSAPAPPRLHVVSGGEPRRAEPTWHGFPIRQHPGWPDDAVLRDARRQLARRPPLVATDEIDQLRAVLADVVGGRGMVAQVGDCAETFEPPTVDRISGLLTSLGMLRRTLSEASRLPAWGIGRIAGQYAKPRSSPTEEVNGRRLPAFRGHLINGPAATADDRRVDPGRLLRGHAHAAATLDLLRRHGPKRPGSGAPAIWVSHEALALDYEEPQTRWVSDAEQRLLTSTHLPWIGDRTRAPDGAHVRFLAQVSNPIGCKVGPTMTPAELLRLCARLDPDRQAGRLVLISRMGASQVVDRLTPLVRSVADARHPVVWLCDPMHGNTVRSSNGYKTRQLATIIAELDAFFTILPRESVWPGGVHLESTHDTVTECVDGRRVTESDLPTAYRTACDPRLNRDQVGDVAAHLANLIGGLR